MVCNSDEFPTIFINGINRVAMARSNKRVTCFRAI